MFVLGLQRANQRWFRGPGALVATCCKSQAVLATFFKMKLFFSFTRSIDQTIRTTGSSTGERDIFLFITSYGSSIARAFSGCFGATA